MGNLLARQLRVSQPSLGSPGFRSGTAMAPTALVIIIARGGPIIQPTPRRQLKLTAQSTYSPTIPRGSTLTRNRSECTPHAACLPYALVGNFRAHLPGCTSTNPLHRGTPPLWRTSLL